MKILLIEDEEKVAAVLTKMLTTSGYDVTSCYSAKKALKRGFEHNHDLIILDLILGDERGETFLVDLRNRNINTPVLVLSCLSEVGNKIDLLKLGADDYLTKPFNSRELLARIEALRRRCLDLSINDEETYGDISFYWKQNKVVRGSKEIILTRKQGKLLHLLVANKGKVLRTNEILEKIWGVEPGHHSNIVQSTTKRLRKRVDNDFEHKLIRNIHGIGYCVVLPTSDQE